MILIAWDFATTYRNAAAAAAAAHPPSNNNDSESETEFEASEPEKEPDSSFESFDGCGLTQEAYF